MSRRSYNQNCGVARALDVVGERWTLLLVREFLTGPKRFKDLLESLPGIGTNLLAARLRDMEGHGIVRHLTLPPPAGSKTYELTEFGRSLEPVVLSLCRWGLTLFGPPQQEEDVRPGWAMVALRSVLDPGAAGETRESYEFCVGGEAFHVRVEGGRVEATQGPAPVAPDLVLSGDTRTFLGLATGRLSLAEAQGSGAIEVRGSPEALQRCRRMVDG